MNKRTKIILIIVGIIAVAMVVAALLLRTKQVGQQQNTEPNLFPFGQPQGTEQAQPISGFGTTPTGEQPGSQTTGTISSEQPTTAGGGAGGSSGGTSSTTPTAPSTPTTIGGPTAPTASEPVVATAPAPSTIEPNIGIPAVSGISLGGAVASPLVAQKPSAALQTPCGTPGNSTCFNKIEAAIYFAKKEIIEIDKIVTLFRGNQTVVPPIPSMGNRLMDLDHCIPGPDYGFANRVRDYLESVKEWQDIFGADVADQYKKNGVLLEMAEVINNFQLESNTKTKNIPMAQDGLAFINATPKYHDMTREYRDRRSARARVLTTLENLNADWKAAKIQADPEVAARMKQEVTVKFSQINEDLPTYDSYIEAYGTYQKLLGDTDTINKLTVTCQQQRGALAGSFANQQTYMGTTFKQSILDINAADNGKKLFCSIDPARVNQLNRGKSCRSTGGLGGLVSPQLRVIFQGDWDDCTEADSADTEYNSDGDYAHPNIMVPDAAINIATGQQTVFGRFDRGPRTTLRNLLQQSNPELTVNQVIDYAFGADANFQQVQIDDEPTFYAHTLYDFGISCEATYTSSLFDYIDELTLYGF